MRPGGIGVEDMRRPTEDEIDKSLAESFPASDSPAFSVGDEAPNSVGSPKLRNASLIRCPSCGAMNRVALDKIDRGFAPRCGRCKTALQIETEPITVTDATFAETVERSPLPVVVDMWAPWCGPCQMLAPVLDELAAEMTGRVQFAKLNVDENPVNAARYDARRIPLLVIFKDGREVDRVVGLMPKAALAVRLEQALGF